MILLFETHMYLHHGPDGTRGEAAARVRQHLHAENVGTGGHSQGRRADGARAVCAVALRVVVGGTGAVGVAVVAGPVDAEVVDVAGGAGAACKRAVTCVESCGCRCDYVSGKTTTKITITTTTTRKGTEGGQATATKTGIGMGATTGLERKIKWSSRGSAATTAATATA
jgi:hypothetical protein